MTFRISKNMLTIDTSCIYAWPCIINIHLKRCLKLINELVTFRIWKNESNKLDDQYSIRIRNTYVNFRTNCFLNASVGADNKNLRVAHIYLFVHWARIVDILSKIYLSLGVKRFEILVNATLALVGVWRRFIFLRFSGGIIKICKKGSVLVFAISGTRVILKFFS